MTFLAGIFQKVLSMSLVGSYIILLVLLARLFLRKSPRWCSYLLWGVVFLRLVLPVFPESDFSLIPRALQMSYNVQEMQPVNTDDSSDWQSLSGQDMNIQSDDGAEGSVKDAAGNKTNAVFPINGSANNSDVAGGHGMAGTAGQVQAGLISGGQAGLIPNEQEGVASDIFLIFAGIWLAGLCMFGGYHIRSYNKLKQQVSGAIMAQDGVYEIKGEHLSFVLGILKPAIYLSGELDEAGRKLVLCHEQIHLKRRDYLIKPIALVITCIHWFNPLVWLAFYMMSRDCEISCDEKVVTLLGEESKKAYSYALLDEATRGQRRQYKRKNTCAVLSFGEDGIKERIKHVLNFKKTPVWLLVCTIAVLAVLVIGLCSNSGNENLLEDAQAENMEVSEAADSITKSQRNARIVLERWAAAFTDRDDQTMYKLSHDKEAYAAWDRISVFEETESAPWPSAPDYDIQYDSSTQEAVIRYWMTNSIPEIYPAYETVKVVEDEGLYYVDHQSFTEYVSIDTKEQLEAAYGKAYEAGQTYELYLNAGYGKAFSRTILNHVFYNTNPEYYDAYKDPVSAVKMLLHLGEGSGKVTEYLYKTAGAALVVGQPAENVTGENVESPGEGSIALVSYTFAADGNTVQIPMVLIDESLGVWGLSTGDLAGSDWATGRLGRDNYMTRTTSAVYSDGSGNYYQISDMGIHKISGEEYRCLYPKYVHASVKFCFYGDKMYFPTDSDYVESTGGSLDWWYDSLCELDINTGEYRYIPVPDEVYEEEVFPLEYLKIHDGFVFLYGEEPGSEYCMALENTDAPWALKSIEKLSEAEQNQFGIFNREYLLKHPGEIIRMAHRNETETFVLIDMDGDGMTEKISIEGEENRNRDFYFTRDYRLKTEDFEMEISGNNLYNEMWGFSPDGENIYIVLEDDGPSADPTTLFFRYEDGALFQAGVINCYIDSIAMADGVLSTNVRVWVLQTDSIRVRYRFNEAGDLEEIVPEIYDFYYWQPWEVTLLKELKLHTAPDSVETFTIGPQTVWFAQVDRDLQWVRLEAKNGQSGWFRVSDYNTVYDDIAASELFEGLNQAG